MFYHYHIVPQTECGLTRYHVVPQTKCGLTNDHIVPQTECGLTNYHVVPQTECGLSRYHVVPQTECGLTNFHIVPQTQCGLSRYHIVPKTECGLTNYHIVPQTDCGLTYYHTANTFYDLKKETFRKHSFFFRLLLATSTGMMGVVAISHHTLQFNVSKFLNNLLVLLKKRCFICLTKIVFFVKLFHHLNVALLRKREREREKIRNQGRKT